MHMEAETLWGDGDLYRDAIYIYYFTGPGITIVILSSCAIIDEVGRPPIRLEFNLTRGIIKV